MADIDLAPPRPTRSTSVTTVRVLLSCGILYSALYVVANDAVAASRYRGYSRVSQAVSELSATGAPTRPFLMFMLPIWTVVMIAFGVGVWKSAEGRQAVRVTGGLLAAFGVTGVLWLPFPMTSRAEMVSGTTPLNDVGHIVLTMVTIILIVSMIGFSAVALGSGFRIYSIVTVAMVLVFGALTGMESPRVPKGETTPFMGLLERTSIGAWMLWMTVLAVLLVRAQCRTAADPLVVAPHSGAARANSVAQ